MPSENDFVNVETKKKGIEAFLESLRNKSSGINHLTVLQNSVLSNVRERDLTYSDVRALPDDVEEAINNHYSYTKEEDREKTMTAVYAFVGVVLDGHTTKEESRDKGLSI